jgi:hypothetical protein
MANAQQAAVTFPTITPAGLQALAAQLDKDLAAVPITSPQRPKIEDLITKIKSVLLTQGPSDPGSWVLFLQPKFDDLTANLKLALGSAIGPTGRCSYSNPDGCIQCTQDQCTALGGFFEAGLPCP